MTADIEAIRARLAAYKTLIDAMGEMEAFTEEYARALMEKEQHLAEHCPADIHTLLDTLAAAEAHNNTLSEWVERLCGELQGTHEHLREIIAGNVTGVELAMVNYQQIVVDLPVMRDLDERVIAQARAMLKEADNE